MVMLDGDERERVRLVELDYEKTNEFIKGVVGTGATLRGSAVTLWVALLGFAFQQSVAWLAVLAALVAVVFLAVDGYHGWLYGEAAKHLRSVEKMISTYYGMLSRGEDSEEAVHDFRRDLRAYRFGLYSHMPRRLKRNFLLIARPLLVYQLVYPFLVVVAVAAAIAIGPLGAGKQAQPTPGVNIGGPQLSLGGLHVIVNRYGAPVGHVCEKRTRCWQPWHGLLRAFGLPPAL
jgi:hypothetical protein